MLIVPWSLDAAWTAASESAADEHAARQGRRVALDLASALIKISRMIPPAPDGNAGGSFLVSGEEDAGVAIRVRHLIEIASGEHTPCVDEPLIANVGVWTSLGFLFLLVSITMCNPQVLAAVHSLMERVVELLS